MEQIKNQKLRVVEFSLSTWYSFSFDREFSNSRPVRDTSLFAIFDSLNKLVCSIEQTQVGNIYESITINNKWINEVPFTTTYFARSKGTIAYLENHFANSEFSFLILDTAYLAAKEIDKQSFNKFLDKVMEHGTNKYRYYTISKTIFEDLWKKAEVDRNIIEQNKKFEDEEKAKLEQKKNDAISKHNKYLKKQKR